MLIEELLFLSGYKILFIVLKIESFIYFHPNEFVEKLKKVTRAESSICKIPDVSLSMPKIFYRKKIFELALRTKNLSSIYIETKLLALIFLFYFCLILKWITWLWEQKWIRKDFNGSYCFFFLKNLRVEI